VRNAGIESGRAEFAFKEVNRIIELPGADKKEYKSHCRKFPNLIQTNGLAAAIAFAYDKKKSYEHICAHVETWLREAGYLPKEENSLPGYLCGLTSVEYRLVTREVLALFNWIRRFASGLIKEEV
jgi:CRISPR-associated protein Cmr5